MYKSKNLYAFARPPISETTAWDRGAADEDMWAHLRVAAQPQVPTVLGFIWLSPT